MSATVDLVSDCAAILACLPQLTVMQVLGILSKYSCEEKHQRIRLTLQDLFTSQDQQDSIADQQNDIELIQKILPDTERCKIVSLMSHVGNTDNRKAVLLRLLLKGCAIEVNSVKHKLADDATQTVPQKKSKIDNGLQLITGIDFSNNNYDGNAENDIVGNLNKDDVKVEGDNVVSDTVDEIVNSVAERLTETNEVAQAANNSMYCTDGAIYQPSTSRAVWDPFVEKYLDDAHAKVAENNFSSTKHSFVPASYNLQQTEKVLRVDLTEKKTDNTTDKVIDLNTENTAVSGVNGVIVDDIDLNKEVEEAFKDFVWDDDTAVETMEDQPVSSVVEDQRKSADVQIVDLVMEMEEAIPVDTKKLEDEVLNKKTSEVFEMVTPKDSGGALKKSDQSTSLKKNTERCTSKMNGNCVARETSKCSNKAASLMKSAERTEDLTKDSVSVNNKLLYPLMEMFPQACPNYLRKLCTGLTFSADTLNELTMKLLSEDYPQRGERAESPDKIDPDEQYEILKQVLPDADPNYLRFQIEQLFDNPDGLKVFISEALEKHDYPTMKDYLRKQQLSAQQRQYTVDFQVAKFLEIIPDPVTYFEKTKKPITIPIEDTHFVCAFLRNQFTSLPIAAIKGVAVGSSDKGLFKIYKELKVMIKHNKVQLLKTKRKLTALPDNCQNIPLLQEMAYISHKQEIVEHMKMQKEKEKLERENARRNGLFQTCSCCYDDEILERDIVKCDKGCMFCKQCVKKSVEIAFGDGKLEFDCLTDCQSHFSLQTLQSTLSPKLFSKLAQKKQMEEVKAAGIEDLEMCPFCDFATILPETDKIFRCLNPECMKESCRQCKEPSHIPLKCDEVERDEDVKRRTYIENKMSEALLRKCHKCGKCFIKSDGCNKITCTCGAMQCYVCGKAVNGYSHFNGQGGDKYHLCPLYSDTEALHEQQVLKGAEAAKAEIGVETGQLKIDPTKDIKNYYSNAKKKAQPLPPGIALNHIQLPPNLHNLAHIGGGPFAANNQHYHYPIYYPPRPTIGRQLNVPQAPPLPAFDHQHHQ